MYNCSKQLQDFHNKKVLVEGHIMKELRDKRKANRDRIKKGLSDKIKVIGMATQGSYAMRTIVQSKSNVKRDDIDIDDGIYFKDINLKKDDGSELAPASLREKIKDAVAHGGLEVKNKKNCVRVIYQTGYHVDIPAYKEIKENEHYQLASGDEWKESDPQEVTNWFNNAVESKSPDKEQMRRIVRLLKYFGKSRETWKNSVPSGFILSVLVEECYQAQKDRDDLSFYDAIIKIKNRLESNKQVYHPVIRDQELTKGNDDSKITFFIEKLKLAIDILDIVEKGCTFKEAMTAWGKVFDEKDCFDSYPDDSGSNNSGGGQSSGMKPPPSRKETDKRGGGRYA